jgi:hypothetical protein
MKMLEWLRHAITTNQTKVTLKNFENNRKAGVGRPTLRCLGDVKSDLREYGRKTNNCEASRTLKVVPVLN